MGKAIFVQAGGGYHNVVVSHDEPRSPGYGEITVRIRASSLNYHDFAVVSGVWGPKESRVPMADGAGEVIALGEGVTEYQIGDAVVSTFFPDWLAGEPLDSSFARVPGDGIDGYAREFVTAKTTAFTHAPIGYSHAESATLTTAALTSWRCLMVDDALKPGDWVLTQGTGGVSIFAIQFAKMAGAKVIATSSNDEKLERLKSLGADHVINYRTTPEWGDVAFDLTEGVGVDHILDVGGPSTLRESMTAARLGGHISLIGILSGVTGELSFLPVLLKQLRLQGVLVGSRAQQQDMIKALNAHTMRPLIDRHFPLEQIVEAFQYLESNRHFGKICLDI